MKKTRKRLQASPGSEEQLSFLPSPDINPKLPSKNTLTHICLSLLLNGKAITSPDFQNITGSWRLAAYVDDLEKLGWIVQREEVKYTIIRKPKTRHIKRYFLSSDIIRKAKKMGVLV